MNDLPANFVLIWGGKKVELYCTHTMTVIFCWMKDEWNRKSFSHTKLTKWEIIWCAIGHQVTWFAIHLCLSCPADQPNLSVVILSISLVYNYPPKGRWIVVDIYRDAERRGIYPPLFTDPEGDSCFSIYQIRWIKKCCFTFFFWNFHETTRHFSFRSQNSE